MQYLDGFPELIPTFVINKFLGASFVRLTDYAVTHTSCRTLFSLCTLKSRLMLTCAPFQRRKRVVLVSATVVEKSKDDRIESNSGSNRKGGPVVRVPATALSWRRVAAASVKQKVVARRAMAKKQVVQDADETVVRKFSIFMTARGNGLFTQSWRPVNVEIR